MALACLVVPTDALAEDEEMALNQLEKETRKMLTCGNQIDGKEAGRLTEMILADDYLSRTERRFVKRLLTKNVCDDIALHKFVELLRAGHA
ncbi:MAG: hypothetical protein C0469_17245 [Cyanobacteria bacterium DS2.3.42]|nr:hypothetical protein [Cyanobacteria bacterium DS2.3.42]